VAEVVLAALLHPVRGAEWPVPKLELAASPDRTTVSFQVVADRRSFVVDLDETPAFRAATADVVGAGAR
jgi:hypothetical protein